MHINKLKYFQKVYPEEDCLGGIITTATNEFSVGTPCIALVRPFTKAGKPSLSAPRSAVDSLLYYQKQSKEKKKKTDKDRTKAIDLYNMDIEEANDLLGRSVGNISILILHNIWSGQQDFYTASISSKSFYFNGTKPLIYDGCLRAESNELSSIIAEEEVKSISNVMINNLKSYRYVNYSITNVVKSNASELLNNITNLIRSFKKALPYSACFFQASDRCRALIDTVSISFYKLSDTIAIFDSSRAEGICMEVLLLSSAVKDVIYPEKTMTWKFLFCKHRDNAFTIDGEEIKRPSDIDVLDGLDNMKRGLMRHVGNDEAYKQESK